METNVSIKRTQVCERKHRCSLTTVLLLTNCRLRICTGIRANTPPHYYGYNIPIWTTWHRPSSLIMLSNEEPSSVSSNLKSLEWVHVRDSWGCIHKWSACNVPEWRCIQIRCANAVVFLTRLNYESLKLAASFQAIYFTINWPTILGHAF